MLDVRLVMDCRLGVRSCDVVNVFVFGKWSRQYLHVCQGKHLLRLVEGNLDHSLVLDMSRDNVMRGGQLLMSGVVVSVVCWWRL